METGGFGGFRDEDDLGDLLPRPSLASSSSMSFGGFDEPADLDANPFADMESSHVYAQPASSYVSQRAERDGDDGFASSSPPSSNFMRESAPEPETPVLSRQHDYSPVVAPVSPSPSPSLRPAQAYSPPPAAEQTPFGSPPASPTAFRQQVHSIRKSPADMLDLLGEEKPILPTFSKRREASAFGALDAVLPVSSLGKKHVNGALATLLGLEDDLPAEVTPAPKPIPAPSAAPTAAPVVASASPSAPAAASTTTPTSAPVSTDDFSPPPAASTAERAGHQSVASLAAASGVPLPPSPSTSPPPTTPVTGKTSRTPSLAPSTTSEPSAASYATIVSPMDTGDAANERGGPGWPGNEPAKEGQDGVAVLGKKLEALKVQSDELEGTAAAKDTEVAPTPSDANATPTETRPSLDSTLPATPSSPPASPPRVPPAALSASPPSPFNAVFPNAFAEATSPSPSSRPNIFEDSSATSPTRNRGFRSYNESFDEGNGFADDADSLRGTYSRSVEVTEEDTGMETETGRSSPVTERESMRTVALDAETGSTRSAMTSPPLPSVPLASGSKSSDAGGALGQSFIISVGDPQKIGSSLNVAAQHTVYTVRTQTTSSAFRKPEFSVLRRFSHFLWLFDALTLNNPGVIVPGMPEKSALGRFGSEFVENRRSALQAALMKIVSHPMLVGDPDLRLFLESDSFSVDIKQRRIETPAENTGFLASLTSTISGPKFSEFDEYFDTRRQILDTFEVQLRSLLVSLANAAKHRTALQGSIGELESALLGLSMCDLSGPLRGALEKSAGVQKRLRELSERQSESEEQIGGLTSVAEGYARLCGSVKLVFGARIKSYHVWQAAEANLRKAKSSHEKAKKSGRAHSELLGLSLSETADAERKMLDARQDFEDVSKLTKAEMARFDKEKVEDFKKAVADYADALVLRQREVVALWTLYHEALQSAADASTPPPPPLQIEGGGDPQA